MPSMTEDRPAAPSLTTAAAASTVKPPENMARWRSSRCSASGQQFIAPIEHARRVRCRGSAVRRPLVNSAKRSCNRAANGWMPNVEACAAANSIASGMPSRCRQIAPMLGSSPACGEKPCPTPLSGQ